MYCSIKLRVWLFLLFLLVPLYALKAQNTTGNSVGRYAISGVVVDSVDQSKLELVTISLISARSDSLVVGTTTDQAGDSN
jgi:hypothetical protein